MDIFLMKGLCKMKWIHLPLGAIQTNAYVLFNENQDALIIDPGGDFDRLEAVVQERHLKPRAILLTHAHFDHIGAVEQAREKWGIPVYLHENESEWLGDPEKNGSSHFPIVSNIKVKSANEQLKGEQTLTIGDFTFEIINTPGHSPGSVSFYFEQDQVVFSGDALFDGSIGRTDLYGGDQMLLLQSIEEKLFTLPEATVVAPGHGGTTTIKKEKLTNPFLT